MAKDGILIQERGHDAHGRQVDSWMAELHDAQQGDCSRQLGERLLLLLPDAPAQVPLQDLRIHPPAIGFQVSFAVLTGF